MKNNNSYRSSSRRRTPWDDMDVLSELETFISSEYKDHYKARHLKLTDSQKEIILLNSYKPASCKICESTNFHKNGYTSNGIQRYKCNDCDQTFTILRNTIFENHKISLTEWIEFLLNLFGYSSINLNSKTNKNAPTTSKYWLAKVFLLLEDYQDGIILSDEVEIDETYYSVISSQIATIDGVKLRGISNNKYCIAIGCDKNQLYCVLQGKGKPSINKTRKSFITHIKEGSTLIHDDEHSHSVLISELNLNSVSYSTKELKGLTDKDNPLRRINHYCFLLKKFLNSHPGFNRNELQGYLNLFSFMMNKPHNKLEKVNILLELSLNTSKKLTYRQYYSSNKPKNRN